ncbi:MAG: hypothetical protein ACYTFY_11505 [Planctomycetota bacterium]|jgi:hypothetical protein
MEDKRNRFGPGFFLIVTLILAYVCLFHLTDRFLVLSRYPPEPTPYGRFVLLFLPSIAVCVNFIGIIKAMRQARERVTVIRIAFILLLPLSLFNAYVGCLMGL